MFRQLKLTCQYKIGWLSNVILSPGHYTSPNKENYHLSFENISQCDICNSYNMGTSDFPEVHMSTRAHILTISRNQKLLEWLYITDGLPLITSPNQVFWSDYSAWALISIYSRVHNFWLWYYTVIMITKDCL